MINNLSSILTQDHLATADPIYVVYSKEPIFVDENLETAYINKFEQAFFIRQNAEDFIAANEHRLTRPYIFVESGYRNYEWKAIRQMLLNKAKEPTF